MNRLAVLGFACVAAAGCTASDYTIYITHNQVITTGCDVPDGTGTTYRSTGQLDVTDPQPGTNFVNPGYFFAPAVVNGVLADTVETNSRMFFMEGADVELRSNGSDASDALIAALAARGLQNRTQRFSGSIPPAATAGVGFFIIDQDQTAAMNDVLSTTPVQVIARARIFGTRDHDDVDSDFFTYPITVCKGCLIEDIGPCPEDTSGLVIQTGGTCNLTQDAAVTCCEAGGATVCPVPDTTGTGT